MVVDDEGGGGDGLVLKRQCWWGEVRCWRSEVRFGSVSN